MVESSKTSLPALVDYIAFAQDRELMNLIGNGKSQLFKSVDEGGMLLDVFTRLASSTALNSRGI